MSLPENGYLLRIFISEADKHHHQALYEWIVAEAKAFDINFAIVLRGMEGYSNHGQIQSAKIIQLATNLPLIIELIDSLEKIEAFIPLIEINIKKGLMTLEKASIRFFA